MTTVNLNFEVEGASLNALRTQLKEVRTAMSEATDPAYMAQLAASAGEVKDKMMDVNESIREMSAGSDFEKVGNSIGGMKEGLMNMDFGKVADSASNLATNVGKISFKSAIGGIKDMGKAFLSVGKALLTNPIFLLAAILVAVVAGVMLLLNSLGLLKPILAAIKAAIGFIVDLFNALTDAMGLTENAAADAAAAQTKASEERIKDLEAEKAVMTANYEATKGMSADELATFEQVTGEKAAGYDDMMNLESDLAAEKMLLTAAASESARIEFGEESQEYADAKDAETKAANDHAAVEQKILLNRVNAANSAEKTLQSLRAGAIENEGARAKAFLQIQQGEAIAKLEAAKKVAEGDLKLAKSPEQKAIVQKTLNDLNESIRLTKESFAKQSTEIDKKAADSARAAQAKAAGDAQKAAADAAKKYEELVKKGLENI